MFMLFFNSSQIQHMNRIRAFITTQLTALRQRVMGENAFSLATYLVVVIPATILTVVADPAAANKSFLAWASVVVSASVIAGVFFIVYGRIVLALTPASARVLVGLVGYALTGALRGGLIGLLSQWSGVLDSVNWQFRLGGGALIGLVLLPVASVFVNDYFDFRSSLKELIAGRARLSELTTNAQSELDAERALMLESINTKLSSAVEEISSQASPGQSVDSYRTLVTNMLAVAETIVRPLSRQLLSGSQAPTPVSSDLKLERGSITELVKAATLQQPFRPLPISLIWAVIGASTMSALKPGFPAVLAYPLFVVLTGIFLWLGKKFIAPVLPKLSFVPRIAVIVGWFVVVAVVPAYVSWLPLANTEREGFTSLAATLLILDPLATLLMCGVLATISGLKSERARILFENAQINDDLKWKLASLRGLLRAQRMELSRTVHGDIQSVFIAVALKLQTAISSGSVSDDVLEDIKHELAAVANFTVGAKEYPQLEKAVEELRSLWGENVNISFSVDAATKKVSATNDVLRATLIDVMWEAVTNAVKHGSAPEISITITRVGETIRLRVENTGTLVPATLTRGTGSELISEVTVNYTLENIKNTVRLTADVPIFSV